MRVRRLAVILLCAAGIAGFLRPAHAQAWPGAAEAAKELPQQLSDQAFENVMNDFSEAGGNFPSDNFVSNETTFQHVIPDLIRETKSGGVYLGVGPDQNFTYIAALQPKIAFIIDIRRQNMIQHLMYKALFELSADRADFLSRLFSRPRPPGIGADSTADELFGALGTVESDEKMFHATLRSMKQHLTESHGFALTAEDEARLEYVFEAFYMEGPHLTYDGLKKHFGPKRSPTYAELLIQTNGAGENRSYMASEKAFRFIQDLQKKNLIIPIVGDFAGEKAIRSVGEFVTKLGGTVSAFYVSNVEQYLFQQPDAWIKFYGTLETLPIDRSAMMIRSVFSRRLFLPGNRRINRAASVSLLVPIDDLIKAFKAGEIARYADVINMSE